MAQRSSTVFVYQPKPGKRVGFDQLSYSIVCAGVDVSRFSEEKAAGLTLRAREDKTAAVLTRTLTADQCEALAKALLDAAAEIRREIAAATIERVVTATADEEGGAA